MNAEPKKLLIKRTGKPPIRFTGVEIGSGSDWTNNSTRWSNVTIWKTKGGKYVFQRVNKTCWQGESDSSFADVCTTPEEIVKLLQGDDTDRLEEACQEAIERASENDPEFAKDWVVEIE